MIGRKMTSERERLDDWTHFMNNANNTLPVSRVT